MTVEMMEQIEAMVLMTFDEGDVLPDYQIVDIGDNVEMRQYHETLYIELVSVHYKY